MSTAIVVMRTFIWISSLVALWGCKAIDDTSQSQHVSVLNAGIAIQPKALMIKDSEVVGELVEHLTRQNSKNGGEQKNFFSLVGQVNCRAQNGLASCLLGDSVRSQLGTQQIFQQQQISIRFAIIIWEQLIIERPDLEGEQQILADVSCRHYLKDNPPYIEGQKFCELSQIRLPHESYIEDLESAYQMAAAMRGNQPFGQKQGEKVSGSLVCLWKTSANPHRCVVNSATPDVNSYATLNNQAANILHRAVMTIFATIEPSLLQAKEINLPPQQIIAVMCSVDAALAKPVASCRVSIPLDDF